MRFAPYVVTNVSLISIDSEIEGLTNYLELEKLRFQNIFDYSITKDENIEDDCALPPMLLQPLVENAIIHGIVQNKDKRPGNINIHFEQKKEQLLISIIDDGIGIVASKKNKASSVVAHESMALEIISKRLDKMHKNEASFEIIDRQIEDNSATGTRVMLRLPLRFLAPHK